MKNNNLPNINELPRGRAHEVSRFSKKLSKTLLVLKRPRGSGNKPSLIEEFKCSIRLALPLIATEIIFALNAFIATAMIAHLGKEELAANALVWNIYIALVLFFVGILCSISIMISQSFGAKDNQGISICFKQGLIMAILFSIPMMLIMWITPIILTLANQDPTVIRHAKPFFHSLILPMLPLIVTIAIEHFLIGITKAKIVMLITALFVPIEIFFYYLFLFGKFGIPKAGLAGIGYSLTISYTIIVICFIAYLHFSKASKTYGLFEKWWIIERKFLIEMFRVGLPLGLMLFGEVAFFAAVAIMMGILSTTTLAAFQIAYQYLLIALMVLCALSQNTSIRVGSEVGRNNRNKLKITTAVNMMMGFGLVSIFAIFYIFFPQIAVGLDIDMNSIHYKDVTIETLKFFPLIAILLIVDCVRIICNGALRGLKDTNFQLLINILGFWIIAFPLTYLLGFKLGFGGVGVWWGIIMGLSITGIMLFIRFNKLSKDIDLSLLVTKK